MVEIRSGLIENLARVLELIKELPEYERTVEGSAMLSNDSKAR